MKKLFLVAVVGLVGISLAKHHAHHGINARQAGEHKRIHDGVKSGELTHDEAKGLRQEQKNIREEKRAALKNDGKIDGAERKEIQGMQKDASKDIYQEKHDAEKKE